MWANLEALSGWEVLDISLLNQDVLQKTHIIYYGMNVYMKFKLTVNLYVLPTWQNGKPGFFDYAFNPVRKIGLRKALHAYLYLSVDPES